MVIGTVQWSRGRGIQGSFNLGWGHSTFIITLIKKHLEIVFFFFLNKQRLEKIILKYRMFVLNKYLNMKTIFINLIYYYYYDFF